MKPPKSAVLLGFWSAVACTVLSLAYVIAQLAEWAGWLGSLGGPSSRSMPFGLAVLLTPSLLLASAFLLLTVAVNEIAPRERQVFGDAAIAFVFEPFDSFLYAVDILGYSFMSLATVMAALALPIDLATRSARRFLLANGAILPFLALQMYVHELIWIASLWAITFPGANWALAAWFRRRRVEGATD
jgi:hypothetical protein